MNIPNHNNSDKFSPLADFYQSIEPTDSWEELEGRIHANLTHAYGELYKNINRSKILFWRRSALSLAACLMISTGLLFYLMGLHKGIQYQDKKTENMHSQLLNQSDLLYLKATYEQIQQLFNQERPWFVLGPDEKTMIGLSELSHTVTQPKEVIVIRLVVDSQTNGRELEYYDVVAIPNEKANIQLPLNNHPSICISLKPIYIDKNNVVIEFDAQINGTTQARSTVTLKKDDFTSLMGLGTQKGQVSIYGNGHILSGI